MPLLRDDLAAHYRVHYNTLTPTFGLEAVVHALHSCASVDVYGFGVSLRASKPRARWQLNGGGVAAASAADDAVFVGPRPVQVPREELLPRERDELAAAEKRLGLPPEGGAPRATPFRYHYWEERTLDMAADFKDKPWTYKSHNFAIERSRLRHLHCAGLLTLH